MCTRVVCRATRDTVGLLLSCISQTNTTFRAIHNLFRIDKRQKTNVNKITLRATRVTVGCYTAVMFLDQHYPLRYT
jgi:hypothetical protein